MSKGVILDAATVVTESSAFLSAVIFTITGPTDAELIFFWGTADGGTTDANWQHSASAGVRGDGEFGVTASGLSDHEVYYFSCKAVQDTSTPGFPSSDTSWASNAPRQFFTLSYPQKVCGSCVSPLRSPVAALSGRWSDSVCPESVKEHFRGGITNQYGVTQSRVQLTAHTTSIGHYTASVGWTSATPSSRSYTPSPTGGQIIGSTGFGIGLTPQAFDGLPPVDGELWTLKKGSWKLSASINVNASFYNRDPSNGGVRGGPYAITLSVYPYSVYLRPRRALPPVSYTRNIAASGVAFDQTFILRSDCFWFCQLAVEVWASQANQTGTVTDVDIATVDMGAIRS